MPQMMPEPERMPEPKIQKCIFLFTETEVISTKYLSEYLYFLRLLYAIIFHKFRNIPPNRFLEDPGNYIEQIRDYIENNLSDDFIARVDASDMGKFELNVLELKEVNSYELVISGCMIALISAVIISGGEVDLRKMKFKLRPLGEGLKKLKDLFLEKKF